MPLNQPPNQQAPIGANGYFHQVWIKWFTSLTIGWSGSFTNGDGDTVTVENGKITNVS